MFLLWHPSLTAINLSYTFPILETSATALCGTTGTIYCRLGCRSTNSQYLKVRKPPKGFVIIRFCLLWCFFGRGRPTPKYSYKNSPLLSFPELCGLVTPWKIHTNAPKNSSRVQDFKSSVSIFQFCPFFHIFFGVHIFPGGFHFSKPFMNFGGNSFWLGCCCWKNQRKPPGAVLEQSFQSREVEPPSRVGFGWVRSSRFSVWENFFEPKKTTTPGILEQWKTKEKTPPKFNMEPEKRWFPEGISFSRGWFSAVKLQGCTPIWSNNLIFPSGRLREKNQHGPSYYHTWIFRSSM